MTRLTKLFVIPLLVVSTAAVGLSKTNLPLPQLSSDVRVTDLRCEYLANPLGIDATQPRLSWKLESKWRGQKQTACQILVASSEKLLQDEQADLARAAAVDDGLAHALGQAGVDNGLADHEHGGDDHHHRAGQAGEGVAGFEHAGEHEGEHDQHRDQVAADPVGDEQHRRTRQGEDGNEHIRIVHKRLS